MQCGINLQAGEFPKVDKRAGWNTAVQVGIFQKIGTIENKFSGKFSKIDKRAGWNKAVQAGFLKKINKLCSTFIR